MENSEQAHLQDKSVELNSEQKVKFLTDLLGQMQNNRKVNEELEHKIAFAVTTLLIGFAAYMMKGEYQINHVVRYSFIFFCLSLTLLAIIFLIRNGSRIKFQCTVIVRIEQALGLYEENLYISSERVLKSDNRPFKEASIFPPKAQQYGNGDWALLLTPHIFIVLLAGIVACTVCLMDDAIIKTPLQSKTLIVK